MKANMKYIMKYQHHPKQILLALSVLVLSQFLLSNAYADLADDAYQCNKASQKVDFNHALSLSKTNHQQDADNGIRDMENF